MYKKALMVLVIGIAVFYGLAMLKFALSQRAATIPNLPVAAITPAPQPPDPPVILTPPSPPDQQQTVEVRPRIDVVFTIDSTGSMGDEIEVVKENIRNIINEIAQGQPAPDVRYGIVTYRDRGDEYVTKSWQFTRDSQAISQALSSIVAAGGGDKPESVNEALHVTLHKMNWDVQAKSKIVFLIGDAGPHIYPNDFRWEDEVAYAKKQNITINTIACSGIEPQEEQVFNQISDRTTGLYAHLTYKQEYAKADGTRTTLIEEGGHTFEISKTADEKDWARGAHELIAKNEAKEISSTPVSLSRDADTEMRVEGGVAGGVVGGVTTSRLDGPVAAPPPMPGDYRSAAKPAAPSSARAKVGERAGGYAGTPAEPVAPGVAVNTKTNNLNTVLSNSIKQAARQQGAIYGKLLNPVLDLKGSNSGVKQSKQLVIENKAQLQALVGNNVDISRIDFANQIVLAVFQGESANDATITISKIALSDKDLIINVQIQAGKDSSKNATPYHIVVLPRQNGGSKLDPKDLFIKFEVN